MNKVLLTSLIVFFFLFLGNIVLSDPLDDMLDQFQSEYESLKPAPNSSVNTDYKLDQTALGALYTTKALGVIYKQNQVLLEKYDKMLEKYDIVIEQNKTIIQLLSKNLKEGKKAVSSD